MLRWIGTLTLALLSGGFALGADDATAQTPKRGGILNFAVVASPPSYDCHAETTFAVMHPVTPHYSLLLKIDAGELSQRRRRPRRELDGERRRAASTRSSCTRA